MVMMKNQTNALKAGFTIDSFKKPLTLIAVALFIVLAAFLILLPNMVSAETTTSTTTSGPTNVIIPIAGYYYYVDSNGGYHPCDFQNCASYVPYNAQSYNAPYGTGSNCARCDSGITRPTYNPYSTDASIQYPIPQYIPYTKTGSVYPSNNYGVSPEINYANGFNSPTYAPKAYVPYEKVGNTIKTGQAKAIPYYSFNANGMLSNGTGNGTGSGSAYTLGNPASAQPINTPATNGNRTGGFIMTSSSY